MGSGNAGTSGISGTSAGGAGGKASGGSGGTMSSGGSGGKGVAGAKGTGGKGGTTCDIMECLIANTCLDMCGGSVVYTGCCSCVPPAVNKNDCAMAE